MDTKTQIGIYIENTSFLLLGLCLLLLPLVLAPMTTDFFILPKQILLGVMSLALLLLVGVRMVNEGTVRVRCTPFDLPILLFTIAVFASSLFAVNRYDSLIAFVPLFFAALSFFIVVNIARTKKSFVLITTYFTCGAVALSVLSILSYLKVYVLPFAFAQSQTFTPMGTLFDQAAYLIIALPIVLHFGLPLLKAKSAKDITIESVGFSIGAAIIAGGIALSLYELLTLQSVQSGLPILPFETGFQTAFASISQDTGRILKGFLFGSGIGTYVTDFTRFKQASYNLNQSLWSVTFFRSSSFILETLATTGLFGLLSFLFLVIRVVKSQSLAHLEKINLLFASMCLAIIGSFLIPFSFPLFALFFVSLALYSVQKSLDAAADSNDQSLNQFYDAELHLALHKKSQGFLGFRKDIVPYSHFSSQSYNDINPAYDYSQPAPAATNTAKQSKNTELLPSFILALFVIVAGVFGYTTFRYVLSDILFQQSLVAYSQNNGTLTYNSERDAIAAFPYRDGYYRTFAQVNLQLANTLASQQPKGATPSAQLQQSIYTLIQQSINAGRTSVAISPQTALDWQVLASIYRSLIGFGQNAQDFAVLANQQAILLDPNNPQEYINLGGIYYQLQQWETAQRQFQIAINLKQDYANAYYNLGHALEEKGDLPNAKLAYETVKTLVAAIPDQLKQITGELDTLDKKMNGTNNQVAGAETQQPPVQSTLKVSTSSAQLPERKPQVKIPPPVPATSSASAH